MAESDGKAELRPGLWETVNERYPGSMISKSDKVPLAKSENPIAHSKLCFVSTSGVQPKNSLPFDTVHPVGDYSFRNVPSDSKTTDLEIHQLKYPTFGAEKDLNVIYPIERLQELQGVSKASRLWNFSSLSFSAAAISDHSAAAEPALITT